MSKSIKDIVTLDKLKHFGMSFAEKVKKFAKIEFKNGYRLWVEADPENDNKPAVYILDPTGNKYKLELRFQDKGSIANTYHLLSNGEVYQEKWLVDNPLYVQKYLNGLHIWDTVEGAVNAKRINKILKEQETFDTTWKLILKYKDGNPVNGLEKITFEPTKMFTAREMVSYPSNSEILSPIKLEDGTWLMPRYNKFGQLGVSYGTHLYKNPDDGGRLIMPEFEYFDDPDGISFYPRAKHPSQVVTNPREGDIYPLFPADWVNTATCNPNNIRSRIAGDYDSSIIETASALWHLVRKYTGGEWKLINFMSTIPSCNEKGVEGPGAYYKVDGNYYPFNPEDIADIQQGMNFTVFLLHNGTILTCGANFRGQLGYTLDKVPNNNYIFHHSMANPVDWCYSIIPIPIDLEGFSAIQVCEQTWIALSKQRLLYGCGANTFSQLTSKQQKSYSNETKLLDVTRLSPIADNVVFAQLSAGNLVIARITNHTLELKGCGYNLDDRFNLGPGYCKMIGEFVDLKDPRK